jgi:HD-GYP domain-containing protein (c-di-GMP phosphodiesterase class II)
VLEIFNRTPLDCNEDWLDFMETLAGQAAIAIDNANLFDNLQRSNIELGLAYDTTLEGWARALELRLSDAAGQSRRMADVTVMLGRALGLTEEELVHVRRGALLHDIGNLGVPEAVLLKTEPLTDDDWRAIRSHPTHACDLLQQVAYLRPALEIPHLHHERWDGTGYPDGLKGNQIPLAARIFAVIDVYESMRSPRPYRQALSREAALDYLREQSGRHFDPDVVPVFISIEEDRYVS